MPIRQSDDGVAPMWQSGPSRRSCSSMSVLLEGGPLVLASRTQTSRSTSQQGRWSGDQTVFTFSVSKARLINGCPYVSHSGAAAGLKCGLPYSRKLSYAGLRVRSWADRRPGCARRGGFSSCAAAGTLRTVDRRSLREKTSAVRLGHRLLCPVLAATARWHWQTCCGSKPFNISRPTSGRVPPRRCHRRRRYRRSSRRDIARRCGRGRVAPGRAP